MDYLYLLSVQINNDNVILSVMKWLFSLCVFFCVISCSIDNSEKTDISLDELEGQFKSSCDSIPIAVYWYWISDNISKEGVVKDLQAMKSVGINKAFIGNIGLNDVPYGKVKFMSDEWWDILHTALKTATELNIEIGIFNSPGWSQSGGPWVKPEQSMRYLSHESIVVEGGKRMEIDLPYIEGGQDVKVLAYPYISSNIQEWHLSKKEDGICELYMNVSDSLKYVRSIIIDTKSKIKTNATLYAIENNHFIKIKSFEIDRTNYNVNVGFIPYSPIVISIPENKSKQYKLVLDGKGKGELSIKLSDKSYIERYPEKTLAKMFQYPLPMWEDYMWDKQVDNNDLKVLKQQVLDLTANVTSEGRLNWNVPDGKWNIVRYAMITTSQTNSPASPEATGLEIDKMSKEHINYHFNSFLGKILDRIPVQDRKCFKVAVMDSYETGGLNWTDDMEKSFIDEYGYSPIPFLPVSHGEVIENTDISNRFLWDFRRLIANRVAYDYVGGLREICHKNGLTTWLENYGHWGFPSEFLQYGGQSDEVAGEYWSEGTLGDIENRAASSFAHIYGKKKVWAESFTAAGKEFSRYPYVMKQRGDRFFTEGINSSLLHVYVHQPDDNLPGVNAWFGNEFNRNNTWFSHLDVFIQYLKRCNLMLQQGNYIADVAYFIGEDVPKMTGVQNPELPKGYSFDYINAEVLMKYASVKDGSLILDSGMKYKVLVLPEQTTMRPELLEKLRDFVNNGLVILGPSPTSSPSLEGYPKSDKIVKSISEEMWSSKKKVNKYGKGLVYQNGCSLDKVLNEIGIIPDMFTSEKDSVLFIHRQLNDGDIYFVSNQSESRIEFSPSFRVEGKQPELWNPITAEIRKLPEYDNESGRTIVPLMLEPLESVFVIFREVDSSDNTVSTNYPEFEYCDISGPWQLIFDKRKGESNNVFELDSLIDWSLSNDNRIRYFSGKASYKTTFNIENIKGKYFYIDLGKVMVMAKVRLNGHYIGGVWTSPYRLPITDVLKEGKNILEIEVVNNWMNTLIGDLNVPKEERYGETFVVTWSKNSSLQSSGLIGPVKIMSCLNSDICLK